MIYPHSAKSGIGITEQLFATEVEKRAKGSIKIEHYWNSELGSGKKSLDAIKVGALEGGCITPGDFAGYWRNADIMGMTYLWKSAEHYYKVMLSPFGVSFTKQIEEAVGGVKIVGWPFSGFKNLWNTKVAVKEPKDLKGLKMRVFSTSDCRAFFKANGALPVEFTFSEVYEGMKMGALDGADESQGLLRVDKFWEAAKYYAKTEHLLTQNALVISKKTWDLISPDVQKIMMDVGKDIFSMKTVPISLDEYNQGMDIIKKHGTTITDVNKELFIESARKYGWPITRDKVDKNVFDNFVKVVGEM